jgi:hypothetical protein
MYWCELRANCAGALRQHLFHEFRKTAVPVAGAVLLRKGLQLIAELLLLRAVDHYLSSER